MRAFLSRLPSAESRGSAEAKETEEGAEALIFYCRQKEFQISHRRAVEAPQMEEVLPNIQI